MRTLAASGSYMDAEAHALWNGKIKRSFDNSPGFRQMFANAIKTTERKSPAGVILGDVTGIEGDRERVGNVLRKIVRGLYYLDAGAPLMSTYMRFNYSQVSPLSPPLPDEIMDIIHDAPLRTVGNVVRYKFDRWDDEPRMTVTWIAFYSRAMYDQRPLQLIEPATVVAGGRMARSEERVRCPGCGRPMRGTDGDRLVGWLDSETGSPYWLCGGCGFRLELGTSFREFVGDDLAEFEGELLEPSWCPEDNVSSDWAKDARAKRTLDALDTQAAFHSCDGGHPVTLILRRADWN